MLPGAEGPRQGCGAGAAQQPAGRGPGTALCPCPGKGAAASGHVSSQLRSQPFPPELPRTCVSLAGRGQGRAKDMCREHGRHVRECPASPPCRGGHQLLWGQSRCGRRWKQPTEVAPVGGMLGWRSTHMAHTSAAAAREVQKPRSGSACSPRPPLPTASQGREEMLSQGTMLTAGPLATQRPHACPFPASCPTVGSQAIVGSSRTPSPPVPILPHCRERGWMLCWWGRHSPVPHGEAPAEQVEGFLPLPIAHISPVN